MPDDHNHFAKTAVCFPLPPFPAESARGYIARAADHNIHQRHDDALRHVGVELKNVLAGRVDAKLLDRIYGLDPNGQEAFWPQSLGSKAAGAVLVHGVELAASLLSHSRRRVSVAGLRKSLHHRHAWTIDALGFCAESWDVLVELCPGCGHKLEWGNGAFWCCDACGIDLRQCRSVRIRREHRPALSVLADLFSASASTRDDACQKLPDFLQDFSLRTKVDFIRLLGRLFDTFGPAGSERRALPHYYPIVMWVGLDVLLNLEERIAALAEPTSAARAMRSDLRAQLKLHASPNLESGKAAIAFLAILEPGFAPAVEEQGLRLGLVASRLRIGTAQARQLVDLGALPSYCTLGGGKRQHDLLASDAVAQLQARLSERISLTNMAARTHVSVKILVGLARAGRLRTVDNELTRFLYKEMQFHLSAIDELEILKRKLRRCDPTAPARIRLRDFFAALGVGFKPWDRAILESIDAGELGAPQTHEMRRATLNISLDWARRVTGGRNAWACRRDIDAESISLIQAEEYLNTLPKDTSCLIAHGQLRRGNGGVTAKSVRRCGRLFISTKEVAVRAGVESIQVAGLAARAGVARPYPSGGFWSRDEIEAALDLPPPGLEAVVMHGLSMVQAATMQACA